jgi:hypothetical protein
MDSHHLLSAGLPAHSHFPISGTQDSREIAHCKFYDRLPAGNARYLVALRRSHTLEGFLEARRKH